ncbi:MAG: multidrug transporter [Phenylobacterium sp. RIFCSPHIGHO2_01_FULL_69_31]|jgi:drug/metabolite transporter (DMT)-like permease|uniref:EamA family transporter n=1 Tax=Phenylobacterium sp. RIFCSPHIGHO2_01_FULL_69_31 TaxID=1801944 RepID=UPI0008D690FD|nr:EamA family transporter [Phenylobacterium sp. RIFCSPHIGHO2_01_FULL_69_31]OHB31375.1 MAG: multidrug transporter [Phenylobacterium sp. RIFCSPHIGHO2_01_FULL_69_31]
MLWIFLTLAAAPLQVARNAMQRGLVEEAGPWGATLVRFLFGLPFSIGIFALAYALTPTASPHWTSTFWVGAISGAIAQVAATAALLMAMSRSGFAVATMLQQSSLPFAALLGWLLLGDDLSAAVWTGVGVATVGLVVLSWPRAGQGRADLAGALLGLAAGAAFAVAFNGFREAGRALDPAHPLVSATAAVVVAQAMQSLVLTAILAVTRPQALRAVTLAWRSSLAAGFFGSAASACWFGALALAPAAPVRAVGLIEGPIAAAVGRKLFREKLRLRQWVGGGLTAVGLLLCILG